MIEKRGKKKKKKKKKMEPCYFFPLEHMPSFSASLIKNGIQRN